ncbi:branched-chain amino acid ABC transporter permease [Maridesulfovibrio ferrireducens]|uniref:branched-chain amino acid ABC transporter permease n=1 Tax=Maridesulfovibrio ferrireducens TaxID=246191 RepID=UPI001A20EF92|nr:branched-chain amino acid ABC transporter permease [Maridesulfovibrio ferrireducens]MBI9110678.1 branched-chain amino acid ABC transporter permease [Maridesulfovibrio ferrireducens]
MLKCGLFFTSYNKEDQFFTSMFQKTCLGLFIGAMLIAPQVLDFYYISVMNLIMIAAIGAVSLNLLTGVCGQMSLGHGAFVGVGAYGCAILASKGLPFIICLLGGGAFAALAGMFFGIPSLRLKGIYLAISTLAAQMILEYVFLHWSALTGGANGMPVDPPSIMGFSFDSDEKMFYLIFGVTILCVLGISNIIRSRSGRAFIAIRDFYQSAENVGVNLFQFKLQAFATSSFIAGIAGGLWAYYTMYITPEQFSISLSISYLAMIIVGGMGSVTGAIFGAVFITLLPEVLNTTTSLLSSFAPDISSLMAPLKEGIFGLTLVLFLIFEPEGLVRKWKLIKAYWKLYPFAY